MNKDEKDNPMQKICFLSNYPPKECGIATFTKDLSTAINRKFSSEIKANIIALNDDVNIYNYSRSVIMEINKDDIDDYIHTAKKINESKDIDLVCIQHEFGIFGGERGNHLLPFLELIEKPVVVTFHSVLPNPEMQLKRIVKSLCDKSEVIVVLAKKAIEILREDYGIDESKISFVPHGIPTVPFVGTKKFKEKLKLEGKKIISTFGLLSRGKGIEYMIRALPKLIKKYPDLLYLIIGETHPVIRKNEGESYRNELMEEVKKLGLQKHVKFYNKFLSLKELLEYILASDVYVCTNLDQNQISSGTLSYAMGCGKVVISTPIVYAKELFEQDRGMIVELKDPESYAEAIDKILSNPELKKRIEHSAYTYARSMTWPNVSIGYQKVFNKALKLKEGLVEDFPEIKLNHLVKMTNSKGMIQFSKNAEPDPTSGYTLDDNSRALIASTLHNKLFNSKISDKLAQKYLKFIENAQNNEGWFRNIFDGVKFSEERSEDAFGRALWALGYTINKSKNKEHVKKSEQLLMKALPLLKTIKSPRAVSFSIIGLYHYYKKSSDKRVLNTIKNLANFLIECYEGSSSEDWHWFEEILSYSNSKLPESLYLAYDLIKDEKFLEIAEKTLAFLTELTFIEGKLCAIGQNGWCKKNGRRAFFDQQPIDVSSLVHTYLTAYSITQNPEYYQKTLLSFNWFFGKNHLNQMVYDETTGGCYDGLGKYSLNLNQGAESTLSYLIARLYLEEMKKFSKIL